MKALFLFFASVLFLTPVMYSSSNMVNPSSEVVIPENETKNFTDDPVAYITENFDLKKHPEFLKSKDDLVFYVTFKCSKGHLVARYNGKGELVSTRQKFRNISVPVEVMTEIYRDYKGWEVKDIDYRASGKGKSTKAARYKILLEKEGQQMVYRKKIKL